MNLRKKLILPVRLCSSFLFLGGLASNTVIALFLSTLIPFDVPKIPQNLQLILQMKIYLDSSSTHETSISAKLALNQLDVGLYRLT